jgi:hypothetical protein
MFGAIFWGETYLGGMPVNIVPSYLTISSMTTAPLILEVSVDIEPVFNGSSTLD